MFPEGEQLTVAWNAAGTASQGWEISYPLLNPRWLATLSKAYWFDGVVRVEDQVLWVMGRRDGLKRLAFKEIFAVEGTEKSLSDYLPKLACGTMLFLDHTMSLPF